MLLPFDQTSVFTFSNLLFSFKNYPVEGESFFCSIVKGVNMVDKKLFQAAEKAAIKFIKQIESYLNSFESKDNRAYLEYFKGVNLLDREKYELQFGYETKEGFEYLPLNFECQSSANIQFAGLPFKAVSVHFHFPDELFGENGFVPIIEFKVKTPKAYNGNVGLVWEELSKKKGELKFHPFDAEGDMEETIMKYYKEDLVDQFSDMLTRSNEKNCETVRKYLNDCLYGKKQSLFRYKINNTDNFNALAMPLFLMYDEDVEVSTLHFYSYAYGDTWINPSEVIMNIFRPISILTKYFTEDGELMSNEEIEALEELERTGVPMTEKKKAISDDKIQQQIKAKQKEQEEAWDPFKRKQKVVKRDEFGYVISGKGKETTGLDTEANRQRVAQAAERFGAKTEATEERLTNFKKYKTADEWFDENKGKRFTVINNLTGLSFVETGKVKGVQALKPPFVLQFGVSTLKSMKQMTQKQALEYIFAVYNLGLLKEL